MRLLVELLVFAALGHAAFMYFRATTDQAHDCKLCHKKVKSTKERFDIPRCQQGYSCCFFKEKNDQGCAKDVNLEENVTVAMKALETQMHRGLWKMQAKIAYF